MNISITMGKEVLEFNLYEELNINTADINHEITRQPQLYGFLGLVLAKLSREVELRENRKNKIFETVYSLYKKKLSPITKRPYSDDLCKSKAITNKKYQKALKAYFDIKYNLKVVANALDSFKQRKDLLQTFSSNNRNNI